MTNNLNEELINLWISYLASDGSVWLFGDIIHLTTTIYPEMKDNVTLTQECKQVLQMYRRMKESPVIQELE